MTTTATPQQQAEASPAEQTAEIRENVLRIHALMISAGEYSPRALEIAEQIYSHLEDTERLIHELESVLAHDKIMADLKALEGEESTLGARKRELFEQLKKLKRPEPPAEAQVAAVEARTEPAAALGPRELSDEERWERAIRFHLYDGRVRGWLQRQDNLDIPVKPKGPLRREHVELYLRAHPAAVDEACKP